MISNLKKILNVVKERQSSDFIHIKDAITIAQQNLEYLSQNKSEITGIPTGFYDLDKATAGLHAGEMIIIAARPGMGKTAFALNIATNAAQNTKKAVAIFSLEMSAEQLVTRVLSSEAMVNSYSLRSGNLQNDDWAKLAGAAARLSRFSHRNRHVSLWYRCYRRTESLADRRATTAVL